MPIPSPSLVELHAFSRSRARAAFTEPQVSSSSPKRLAVSPGIRPEDVFINVLEAAKENWSLGNDVASFAEKA